MPSKLQHDERTSSEPRSPTLHPVRVAEVQQINSTVRTIRLSAAKTIPVGPFHAPVLLLTMEQHEPGQWVDLHIPSLARPGGFTITSSPHSADASRTKAPHIDLAIQQSTISPAAQWLWHSEEDIVGKELGVRVGGSFVWQRENESLRHVLFIAGGVGINPLVSMLRHVEATDTWTAKVTFAYSVKTPEGGLNADRVLFLNELMRLQDAAGGRLEVKLFMTGSQEQAPDGFPAFSKGRMSTAALGGWVEDAQQTMAYVCGPPEMTDEVVGALRESVGMAEERVLCEKWW